MEVTHHQTECQGEKDVVAVGFVKTGAPVGVTTATPAPSSAVHAPSAPQLIVPPRVECVEDTGIEPSFIADLILKIVYFHGVIPAGKIADVLRLPFAGVIDGLIDGLKTNHAIEVQGTNGPLLVAYKYALTDKGFHKVQELLRRSNYAGACPVTLEDYTYMVGRQRARDAHVTRAKVEEAFSQMVLAPRVLEQLGPAINSGESIFVLAHPATARRRSRRSRRRASAATCTSRMR